MEDIAQLNTWRVLNHLKMHLSTCCKSRKESRTYILQAASNEEWSLIVLWPIIHTYTHVSQIQHLSTDSWIWNKSISISVNTHMQEMTQQKHTQK
jgi:hypothetical protein